MSDEILGGESDLPEQWENASPPPWTEPPDCMGSVICCKCGKFHGYCREVSEQLQPEENNMIHRSQSGKGARTTKQNDDLVPYLTASDLSVDPKVARILAARVQPDNFKKDKQVVVVKLAIGGFMRLWTLRDNNPNLDVVCDAFGEDESKWAGCELAMFIEKDEFDNKEWIRAEARAEAPSNKGKK